jgi:hypothetical protein
MSDDVDFPVGQRVHCHQPTFPFELQDAVVAEIQHRGRGAVVYSLRLASGELWQPDPRTVHPAGVWERAGCPACVRTVVDLTDRVPTLVLAD